MYLMYIFTFLHIFVFMICQHVFVDGNDTL